MFTIENKSTRELIKMINSENLKMPTFQRDYVWDINQQKQLIGCILTGIPTGGFLAYNGNSSFNIKNIGFQTRSSRPGAPNEIYLLDGQQRVTTIYSVFYDLFENNDPDQYFKKIRNRWFLDLSFDYNEGKYLMGLFNFNFKRDIILNADIEEVGNIIKYSNDIKESCDKFYYKLDDESIVDYCGSSNIIPLFYLYNKTDKIREILLKIRVKRTLSIINDILDKKFTVEELEQMFLGNQELIDKSKNYKLNIIEWSKELENILTENIRIRAEKWSDNIFDFCSKILDNYVFAFTNQNSIKKVIDTFILTNIQGVKLSTFDLVCANFNAFELRSIIEEECSIAVQVHSLRSNIVETVENFIDDLFIKEKNEEYHTDYLTLFTQTLALYNYFIIKGQDIEKLKPDIIKSKYILDLDASKYDDTIIRTVIKILNNVLVFLHINCGIRKISHIDNNLSLIPIISNVIVNNINFNTTDISVINKLERIRKNYFQKLLLGYYDKDQSQNCIQDSILLNLILNKNSQAISDYNSSLITVLKNDFLNERKLTHEDFDKYNVPKESAVNSILAFIESYTEYGSFLDFSAEQYSINYSDEIHIHHIMPIGSLTDPCVRKNKQHLVNSVLNKTRITVKANLKLKKMDVKDYMDKILTNTQFHAILFQNHLLSENLIKPAHYVKELRPNPPKGSDLTEPEKILVNLYKERYVLLYKNIQNYLKIII